MIDPNKLNARMLERLATRVIEALPPPHPWWAFWRKERVLPKVREIWEKIRTHARFGLTAATLGAIEYDVVRDCAEYGPWNEEDIADLPTTDLLN